MAINYDAPIIIRDGRNGGWLWVDKEVWADKRLSASDKVTYGTLAYFANNKTQSLFPSITMLEKLSVTSTRQIYYSIKKLETLHYIHIKRYRGKPNEYTLIDDAIQEQKQGGANSAGVHGVQGSPAPGAVQGVQNNRTNNIYTKQELTNNNVNLSYKTKIDNIVTWAFTRAMGTPSCSREQFSEAVEKAIARAGYDSVHAAFAEESNAIRFLTVIKNL